MSLIYAEGFNILASRRAGLNLYQKDVAEKIGVTRQAYINWEKNGVIPEVKYLNKLSEVLEIEIGVLVTYFTNRSK